MEERRPTGEPQPQRTLYAFSTLACPEWSPEQVVRRAAQFGYDAIEWRGGPEGHVAVGWTSAERAALRRQMAAAGVKPLAVTAYSTFSTPDDGTRTRQASDLAAHLELASDLEAPFVRTFLADPEDGAATPDVLQRAVDALGRLAARAARLGVEIAIEPHDDLVRAEHVVAALEAIDDPFVGAVWDPVNAWKAGEDPATGAALLGRWIRYIQIKDARRVGSHWLLCRVGEGDVPLLRGLRRLAAIRPLPPLSLEWERAWHRELEPADVVLEPSLASLRALAVASLTGHG